MDLQIRPMTSKDKTAIVHMLQNIPEFKPAEILVAEEVIDSYLLDSTESGYHIFVAETDSGIVGYICFGPTPLTEGTWDLYWVAVAPNRQSQGIGKSLLLFAEEAIKGNKGRMIAIETSSTPEYETTRRFYLGQGYEPTCRIADFYTIGDDKMIMVKRLT